MKVLDSGRDKVTNNGTFIFPKDEELTGDELISFVKYNTTHLNKRYRHNMHEYLGKHKILKDPVSQMGSDNKLVVNMPKYLVDTYNGFFSGIPPKITLDDENQNKVLQDWNNAESMADVQSEISKQTDIYGKSIAFIYQGEDSQPHLAYSSPSHAFIIYDDTVARKPIAFVRYSIPDGETVDEAEGTIQYADKFYKFKSTDIELDTDQNAVGVNPYGMVPAVEFYENEERQGVFDGVDTLIQELDRALSQKANQVEYFDNAYLAIMGILLDTDEEGNPKMDFKKNRVLYLPNIDPNSPEPMVEFLSKPDADQIQEHLIDRLTNMTFQMSMVPNLNDEQFAGNSSGVALEYKLLPMVTKASSKERKFTQSFRELYKIVFTVLFKQTQQDAWRDLQFQFTRNLPANVADEIASAKNAEGIVSKETQLSLLSFVQDPQAELKKMQEENAEAVKQAQENMQAVPDYFKSDEDGNPDNSVDEGEPDGSEEE